MLNYSQPSRRVRLGLSRLLPRARKVHWLRGLVCAAAVVALIGAGAPQTPSGGDPYRPLVQPIANPTPDKNDQMLMRERAKKKQDFEAANAERKKQLENDTKKLLELAISLKTEVDKTNKDTLSISVIRKAEAIEKLAHDVRKKMNLTMGAD